MLYQYAITDEKIMMNTADYLLTTVICFHHYWQNISQTLEYTVALQVSTS
tara:strand:+ start:7405 stop:7554 length:150 start_codon:yes stop_codon:yes gene_type:complete